MSRYFSRFTLFRKVRANANTHTHKQYFSHSFSVHWKVKSAGGVSRLAPRVKSGSSRKLPPIRIDASLYIYTYIFPPANSLFRSLIRYTARANARWQWQMRKVCQHLFYTLRLRAPTAYLCTYASAVQLLSLCLSPILRGSNEIGIIPRCRRKLRAIRGAYVMRDTAGDN